MITFQNLDQIITYKHTSFTCQLYFKQIRKNRITFATCCHVFAWCSLSLGEVITFDCPSCTCYLPACLSLLALSD